VKLNAVCHVQGNICGCDDKFASVFGCLQASDIIGKDIADVIPSVAICDSETTAPASQVFFS